MGLLVLGQRQFHLRLAPAVEIDGQRHQRHALALDGAVHPGDLPLVQQQLAGAFRLMVEAVAMAEFGDVAVDQPHLLALHLGIAFRDRSEEHTSELQSLMRISYAVFCLKKKTKKRLNQISLMTSYPLYTCTST